MRRRGRVFGVSSCLAVRCPPSSAGDVSCVWPWGEAAPCLRPQKLRAATVLLASSASPHWPENRAWPARCPTAPTAEAGTHTRWSAGLPRGGDGSVLPEPPVLPLSVLGDHPNFELPLGSLSPHPLSSEPCRLSVRLRSRRLSFSLELVPASLTCALALPSRRMRTDSSWDRQGVSRAPRSLAGEEQGREARGLAPGSNRPSWSPLATWS